MSRAFKFMKHFRQLKKSAKVLSATAVTAAAVTGAASSRSGQGVKDQVIFLSREENLKKSKARIVQQDIIENRDPILPDGSINWACSCIEKEVVGPCNIEFRGLRQFMHIHDIKEDLDHFPAEVKEEFDRLFEAYIICTMDNPVYYKDMLLDEEKEDIEKREKEKKEMETKKRLEKQKNTRIFGKDKVVFLTKEENQIPSTVLIPKVQVEENRGPVLPNGEVNWACTCIEKDVVGPCNIEFRKFRQLVHENANRKEEGGVFTEEERNIIGNFIACIRENPVYYASFFSKDTDDEDTLNSDD